MIIIYSKNNCPACTALKQEMLTKDILHDVINIDEDMVARGELLDAGIRSVPQIYDNVSLSFITREQAGL